MTQQLHNSKDPIVEEGKLSISKKFSNGQLVIFPLIRFAHTIDHRALKETGERPNR